MDEKDNQIKALKEEIHRLREELDGLRRMLGLNSSNSSKPPSLDGFKKPTTSTKPVPKSLRQKGTKKSGGQPGHKGETLKQVANSDQVIHHSLTKCPCCQLDLAGKTSHGYTKRQVMDIPPITMTVTEHRAEIKYCSNCQKDVRAEFPTNVRAPVQYGDTLKSFIIYLNQGQFIPEDRLQLLMSDLFGCSASTSTFMKMVNQFSADIEEYDKHKMKAIINSPVRHSDETSIRIGGKTCWLQLLSTTTATAYWVTEKRGAIIKGLTSGVLVHDHFKPYFAHNPDVEHGLCNAHHLRELQGLIDIEKEGWARWMQKLLLIARKSEDFMRDRIMVLYDKIVVMGLAYHESLAPLSKQKRGRRKRRPGHNLLIRFRDFKSDVLRFLLDRTVPFTNNLAEQDVRMMKVRQKISGGFRGMEGAMAFARIRGFMSTCRKEGRNLLEAIQTVLNRQTASLYSF